MAWKKVPKFYDFVVFEEPGDVVEGTLIGFRTIETEFGEGEVADLIVNDLGEIKSVFISAGMPNLKGLENMKVRIEYLGEQKNPRTKRKFKAFDVYVEEPEDEK